MTAWLASSCGTSSPWRRRTALALLPASSKRRFRIVGDLIMFIDLSTCAGCIAYPGSRTSSRPVWCRHLRAALALRTRLGLFGNGSQHAPHTAFLVEQRCRLCRNTRMPMAKVTASVNDTFGVKNGLLLSSIISLLSASFRISSATIRQNREQRCILLLQEQ